METNDQNNNVRRERISIKLTIISLLCILLIIPWIFIRAMISERDNTESMAEIEVYEKWGNGQCITGPFIQVYNEKDVLLFSMLPETLDITGDVRTRTLSRGIYDFTVYDADITLAGTFLLPANLTDEQKHALEQGNNRMTIDLSSLKGLTNNPVITIGGQELKPQEISNEEASLVWQVDIEPLLNDSTIGYEIHLPIRGSQSLDFVPTGNTTTARLHSDCATPSFGGAFLPTERTVTDDGFDAQWRVLALNRNYPQLLTKNTNFEMVESAFGVELRRPVEQYQQNERAVKYAFLVVLFTFAAVFFVEVRREHPIHPVQYLLIGIAVMLFYTLLLSFSEHLSFPVAYLIASVMTDAMITLYLSSIMHKRKAGFAVGGLLALLYTFIFILLQIESYALLVGSVGIFVLLAIAMSASRNIDWYRK